jgi:L-2-hydroxyglutarate oxidase LhgO
MHVDSLTPAFTGIRPKLSQTGFHDFVINKDLNGFVNLIGIESPGLTSSLAIGEYIAKILD